MAGLAQIRTIVDWNDDAFFEPIDGQTLTNLVPDPLSHASIDVSEAVVGATVSKEQELTLYGLNYYRCVTGTATNAGMQFGGDTSFVTDDIPVSASSSYRFSVWLRGVSSYSGVDMILIVRDQANNIIGTTSTFTLTANWVQATCNVTTGGSATHVRLVIRKNTAATNITFDATGFMLVAGTTTPTYFNTGDTYSRYEDISTDVMQATWLQEVDVKSHTPRDGKLTLVLDNSTRKYSPRYASSVLYGAFKHGLRVRVEVKRSSTSAWVVMWAGWVTGYDITPGKTIGDKQMVITASQGIVNLDAAPLQDNLQENVTFDAVLPGIVMKAWYPPTTPYVFVADVSYADENAYAPDQDDFIATLDTGITTFPLVGDGWSDTDTRASKVLQSLMEVEQGWLYLDREGRMNFRSREEIQWNTTADFTVNLNTQAKPLDYVFGPGEVNSVNLTYYPSGETENAILWTQRGRKLCNARNIRRIIAKFEYEEGQKKTVKSINAFGSGGDDSTITATIAGGGTYDSRYYSVVAEMRNGFCLLTIYNQGPTDAYFSILLKGTIEVNADSEQVQVVADNRDAIRDTRIKNKLLKDEDMAEDLGNYIISRHSADYDEFRSFEVTTRDSTWLDRMLDIYTGAVVSLTEYQTAVDAKKHLVVGANHTWTPGLMRSVFQTTRVDETEYWILGTSELSHETILAY